MDGVGAAHAAPRRIAMFRKKSLKQHERELADRFSGRRDFLSRIRLRYRCDHAVEALRLRKQGSPQTWALHAQTLSKVARYLIHSGDSLDAGERMGISMDSAIRCMAACVKRCKDRCDDYRRQGINPQVEVIVNDCLEHAKVTYEEWKRRTPPHPAA